MIHYLLKLIYYLPLKAFYLNNLCKICILCRVIEKSNHGDMDPDFVKFCVWRLYCFLFDEFYVFMYPFFPLKKKVPFFFIGKIKFELCTTREDNSDIKFCCFIGLHLKQHHNLIIEWSNIPTTTAIMCDVWQNDKSGGSKKIWLK